MKLISDNTQIYNFFSKEIQSHLEELYELDNKNNVRLLNKILQFENENKVLKEQNKNIQGKLVELKESIKNAQKDSAKLRQNYKILKEEEDLLVKLQSTKKLIQQNEAESSGEPPLKRIKTTEGSIDNRNVTSMSSLVNEGLLII